MFRTLKAWKVNQDYWLQYKQKITTISINSWQKDYLNSFVYYEATIGLCFLNIVKQKFLEKFSSEKYS